MEEKSVDLGKIKDAELIRTREFGKTWSWVIYGVGAICSLFHLYCLLLRPIDPWYFRGMHILFLGFLCFLLYPGWEGARKKVHPVDYLLILMLIVPFVYMVVNLMNGYTEFALCPPCGTRSSRSCLFCHSEMTRRTTGLAL